ncbi:MAG TPA: RidA family protein [Stellaceae bacterium]|nr:RidA family protein [Stellaceae bacterium]
MSTIVHPEGWPPARGFAHGVLAEGRTLWVAGQWGSDQDGNFPAGLPAQLEQALRNIVAILAAGGARPEQVVRLTWYVTDAADYNAKIKEVGAAYRRVMGKHFPAMAVVEVNRLVDARALVEIEATAVLG